MHVVLQSGITKNDLIFGTEDTIDRPSWTIIPLNDEQTTIYYLDIDQEDRST